VNVVVYWLLRLLYLHRWYGQLREKYNNTPSYTRILGSEIRYESW